MQNDKTLQFWDDFYRNEQHGQVRQDEDDKDKDDVDCDNKDETQKNPTKKQLTLDNRERKEPSLSFTQPPSSQNSQSNQTKNSSCFQGSEWILKPSDAIFQMIRDELQQATDRKNRCTNANNHNENNKDPTTTANNKNIQTHEILEIGCGSSQFSLCLWEYLIKTEKQQQQHEQQRYCVAATDVSTVCIEQNKQRDCNRVQQFQQEQQNDDTATDTNHRDSFRYEVLNVLVEPDNHTKKSETIIENTKTIPNLDEKFYMILDKGCFDTFLFRSRKRGQAKAQSPKHPDNKSNEEKNGDNQNTPISSFSTSLSRIQRLLDNIHSWLQKDGIYIIFTPRRKITYIRDYKGFAHVKKVRFLGQKQEQHDDGCSINNNNNEDDNKSEHDNDPHYQQQQQSKKNNKHTFVELGALDGNKKNTRSTTSNNKNVSSSLSSSNSSTNNCEVYMYVCLKNNRYKSSTSSSNQNTNYAFRGQQEANTVPQNEDTCPKCNMTFLEFRKGEDDIYQRGIKYWTRTWKGHKTHCKG